jgi:hypothetical protein
MSIQGRITGRIIRGIISGIVKLPEWILARGLWNDIGSWQDGKTWID